MKNKTLALERVEQLRQKIRNINYLIRTNGSFDDITIAFEQTYNVLENLEGLISIESDPFRTNQIV